MPPVSICLVHMMWGLLGAAPVFCQRLAYPPIWLPPSQFDAIEAQLEFCPSIGRVQYSFGRGDSGILATGSSCTVRYSVALLPRKVSFTHWSPPRAIRSGRLAVKPVGPVSDITCPGYSKKNL